MSAVQQLAGYKQAAEGIVSRRQHSLRIEGAHQEDFARFCQAAYQNSLSAGWWPEDDKATRFSTRVNRSDPYIKIALIHSELSEALEGLRRGRKDEKLPHRDEAEVEFGDAIIRVADFLGRVRPGVFTDASLLYKVRAVSAHTRWPMSKSAKASGLTPEAYQAIKMITVAHQQASYMLTGLLVSPNKRELSRMAQSVILCCLVAGEFMGYDIPAAIDEKMKYNSERADHKPEVRAASGGKKF